MSYFTSRPRSYSKPTCEELKELTLHLSQCNVDELRSVIQLAATQSSEVAHVFMEVLHAQSPCEPDRTQQQNYVAATIAKEHGVLTPSESSEDSEMNGTENVPQQPQHTFQLSESPFEPLSPAQQRCLKRKSLADWHDDISAGRNPSCRRENSSFWLNHSLSTKRRRPFQQDVALAPLLQSV